LLRGNSARTYVASASRSAFPQEELGFRSSLHRTEIGLLERGARVPRIDTVVKIATGLGIQPNALVVGIAWTPPTATTQGGGFTRTSPVKRTED
jgi:transcriptional regulator with XRE-family HTH domain